MVTTILSILAAVTGLLAVWIWYAHLHFPLGFGDYEFGWDFSEETVDRFPMELPAICWAQKMDLPGSWVRHRPTGEILWDKESV